MHEYLFTHSAINSYGAIILFIASLQCLLVYPTFQRISAVYVQEHGEINLNKKLVT